MKIDKNLVISRFSSATGTYDSNAHVQRSVALKLLDYLSGYASGTCRKVLEVGCGTGILSRAFLSRWKPEHMWLNDLCPDAGMVLKDILSEDVTFFPGDAETIAFPSGLDMIISSSAMQWFEDIDGFFSRCAMSLSVAGVSDVPASCPDGILAVTTFGRENFIEISSLEGVALDYVTLEGLKRMAERYFDVLFAAEEIVRMDFSSPADVLRHMRMTGVTGLRKDIWTRERLDAFCRRYKSMFPSEDSSVEGGVRLTYNPMYLICRKKRPY